MAKKVYPSKIGAWVWVILIVTLGVIFLLVKETSWRYAISVCGGIMAVDIVMIFDYWYVITDDELVVYRQFIPKRFPISAIKEVRKTTGYIGTSGMSNHRLTITFTDSSSLRSRTLLHISPIHRSSFITHLLRQTPAIKNRLIDNGGISDFTESPVTQFFLQYFVNISWTFYIHVGLWST